MIKKLIIKIIVLLIPAFVAKADYKVVLFGDSLMAGYGLDKKYHLSNVLEKNLNKKGLKVNVINASVSGDTSAGGLNRIDWTISEKNIDIILLGLGANDMLRGISPNETEKNLEEIIIKILNKKIQIVIAGMIAPDSHGDDYKNEFDKIFKRLSIKYELDFIPFLLDGVALNPDLNLDDGMHPNEKGVIVISKNIEKKLLNILN
jgi:acyl-CoA thioesterase-1